MHTVDIAFSVVVEILTQNYQSLVVRAERIGLLAGRCERLAELAHDVWMCCCGQEARREAVANRPWGFHD